MTSDEFERVVTSLKHVGGLPIVGIGHMIPYRAVIEILHSNLHQEDRASYHFDWVTNTVTKREDPK